MDQNIQRRQKHMIGMDDADESDLSCCSDEEQVCGKISRDCCLSGLNERQRMIALLLMAGYQKYEIAFICNCTPQTISREVVEMRKCLENSNPATL